VHNPSAEYDAIICGHGLAGATLAWQLSWRGWRVGIVDPGTERGASGVAAGIVTPITGQRLVLSWRIAEFLPIARDFYARTAATMGPTFWQELTQVRLWKNDAERATWEQRRAQAEIHPFLDEAVAASAVDPRAFHEPQTGIALRGARLDVRGWLAASRAHWQALGVWHTGTVAPEDCHHTAHGVQIQRTAAPSLRAGVVLFCLGPQAQHYPLAPWLRWKCAKGELLRVRIPDFQNERRLLNRGLWLLPLAEPSTFAAGATYAWDDLTATPTAGARRDLETRLATWLRVPFTVEDHVAGIRPIIQESRAVLGMLPSTPRFGIFNGLGSKGVLHAPYAAANFADHLVSGMPLDRDLDLLANNAGRR
jgi:glycine oxidase